MIEQGSPEWFAERCGHITASYADVVLSKGKDGGEAKGRRNYRFQLAFERMTGRPCAAAFEGNSHTQRGNLLEPTARSAYFDATGELPTVVGFVKHPQLLWVGASPDSIVVPGKGGLEIKCPLPAIHIEYIEDGPPNDYRKQMQFQMWVLGWEWVDFVSYNADAPKHLRTHIQRISRDEVMVKKIELETKALLVDIEKTVQHLSNLKRAA